MRNKPLKCGLYLRVSTQHQMTNEYNSIESQRERLVEYCKLNNYDVYRIYEDGGISAGTLDRPELRELIRDISCGNINCVIVYKLDRISRSMGDFYKLYEIFEQYGTEFISISQNFDTSTSMGRLNLNVLMGFAQFEREMDGDRIRDKLEQRAKKGMWHGGSVPYGYKSQESKLIIDPEEAERVLFMFKTYELNPSLSHLRNELHLRGWYNRQGKPWLKTGLDSLLNNCTYIGILKHKDKLFPGIHEPIISKELFDRVQKVHPNRTHAKSRINRIYLLKGLLKCGCCGSYMTPHYTRKTKRDGSKYNIPYYRCSKTTHHNFDVCEIKNLNANNIEKRVIEYLSQISNDQNILEMVSEELNRDNSQSIAPLENERNEIQIRISGIKTEIENLVNALAKGNISQEYLEEAITERKEKNEILEQRKYLLESEINNYRNKPYEISALRESLINLNTIFNNLTPQEKAEALQCIIQKVEVHSDRLVLNLYEMKNVFAGSQKRLIWWS